MMRFLYFFVFITILLSCDGDSTGPVDLRLEYYPMELNQTSVYRMDSVIYDPVGDQIVELISTSYRREILIDSTELARNEVEFSIEVSYKKELSDPEWIITHYDRVSRFANELKRSYENQRFVPLNFPPEPGVRWNGLAFIDADQAATIAGESILVWQDWGDYEIISEPGAATYSGVLYDDVVRVEEANFDDEVLILRESFADYAAGVGLVYRQQRIYDLTCSGAGTNDPCRDTSVPWEEDVEMGFSLMQTLIQE